MGLDAEGKIVRDCYVNAVKEVSFLSPSLSFVVMGAMD